jgi:hypothetical protein
MPQLNVHVPASSDLLARVEAAAQQLGTTPSALARVVLDVALEPYVEAQLDLHRQVRVSSSRMVASLHTRFSGALPARPFVASDEAADQEGGPGDVDDVPRDGLPAAPSTHAGHAANGAARAARNRATLQPSG